MSLSAVDLDTKRKLALAILEKKRREERKAKGWNLSRGHASRNRYRQSPLNHK